jgi:hypothetical protein
MAELRVYRAALGFPVWTFMQDGDVVKVVIDPECPESEQAILAALTAILDGATNAVARIGAPRTADQSPEDGRAVDP